MKKSKVKKKTQQKRQEKDRSENTRRVKKGKVKRRRANKERHKYAVYSQKLHTQMHTYVCKFHERLAGLGRYGLLLLKIQLLFSN